METGGEPVCGTGDGGKGGFIHGGVWTACGNAPTEGGAGYKIFTGMEPGGASVQYAIDIGRGVAIFYPKGEHLPVSSTHIIIRGG